MLSISLLGRPYLAMSCLYSATDSERHSTTDFEALRRPYGLTVLERQQHRLCGGGEQQTDTGHHLGKQPR